MSENSKQIALFVGFALVVIAVIAASMLGMRWVNASTVAVTIHSPQPGIVCAVATSADGVGISCWEAN